MTTFVGIGMTGMLWPCVMQILAHDQLLDVVLVSRRAPDLSGLSVKDRTRVRHLPCDYADPEQRKHCACELAKLTGVELVIAWVHSNAPHALEELLEHVDFCNDAAVLQVFGSAASRPESNAFYRDHDALFSYDKRFLYQKVVLGFEVSSGRSRWLTHSEISGGVFKAWQSGSSHVVVGVVEPWSSRP